MSWQPGVTEQTLVETMEIPDGDDWRWLPQLNMIVLSPRLDDLARRRALDEVAASWRTQGYVEVGA